MPDWVLSVGVSASLDPHNRSLQQYHAKGGLDKVRIFIRSGFEDGPSVADAEETAAKPNGIP